MRPTRISLPLTATGYSPLVPHDYWQMPVNVSLGLTFSSDAAGGYAAEVQYTIDDISPAAARQAASISRSGTTITVTGDAGYQGGVGYTGDGGTHGLSVGDWVQLTQTGGIDGWYNVASVVSETSYTLTSATSGTFQASGSSLIVSARMFPHPTLVDVDSRQVGNYSWPVRASRLVVTAAGSAGVATLSILQGGQAS